MVAHASVASSKSNVELDSHSDIDLGDGNCLFIHDHDRSVNVFMKIQKMIMSVPEQSMIK